MIGGWDRKKRVGKRSRTGMVDLDTTHTLLFPKTANKPRLTQERGRGTERRDCGTSQGNKRRMC